VNYHVGEYTTVTGGGESGMLTVNVFGPTPERNELSFEFDMGFGFGIFDLGLEFDRSSYEWDYSADTSGVYDGLEVWEQSITRFAASADASITDRISIGLAAERLAVDYEDDDYVSPSSFEAILAADIGLWENWGLLLDLRGISYTDITRFLQSSADSLVVDDGDFFAPYVALVYTPRENVEIRLGYGVNPTNYTDTPVEGRANGRERWRSEYLWEKSEYDLLDAEQALEDATTIGVMAVLTF
jgi:hypothetical protein